MHVEYVCRNCKIRKKVFSLFGIASSDTELPLIQKIGELPSFGPPISEKLLDLIGADKELFLSGRRSENQGLGIGAYSYYRRVVENQKNKIFDKIIEVAKMVSTNPETIEELELAKKENQFTKGVEKIKHALPESLLIRGQNPLTLLY